MPETNEGHSEEDHREGNPVPIQAWIPDQPGTGGLPCPFSFVFYSNLFVLHVISLLKEQIAPKLVQESAAAPFHREALEMFS